MWSHSLSKDTGLGSTAQTNDTPMSCLDLIHTPTVEHTSGYISIIILLHEKMNLWLLKLLLKPANIQLNVCLSLYR